jgi:dihydrofolate reductase
VLTRNRSWQAPGAIVVHDLHEAFAQVGDATELVVIGGAELFKLFLPLAERIYLTDVHATIPGDTHFPELAADEWRELEQEAHTPDANHTHAMTFRTLARCARKARAP